MCTVLEESVAVLYIMAFDDGFFNTRSLLFLRLCLGRS